MRSRTIDSEWAFKLKSTNYEMSSHSPSKMKPQRYRKMLTLLMKTVTF